MTAPTPTQTGKNRTIPTAVLVAMCTFASAQAHAAGLSLKFDVQLRATSAALVQAGVPKAMADTLASSSFSVGTMSDQAQVDATKFSAQSAYTPGGTVGSFLKSAGFARGSVGVIQAGTPATQTYQDARASKPRYFTRTDAGGKTASVLEGAKVLEKANLRGSLVDIVALTYGFAGRPEQIKPFAATLATGKSMASASFAVQKESITVAGTAVPAIRLYRQASAADTGIEIWYRASDGVPLMTRMSLNAKYGATLTSTVSSLPPAFKL
jgi:hypothetical protein